MTNDEVTQKEWNGLGTTADEASKILNYILAGWKFDDENNLVKRSYDEDEDEEWWGDF